MVESLTRPRPVLLLENMHGMGDNIISRAVLRQYLARDNADLWVATPWPSLFHDLPIHVTEPKTRLRTQRKNIEREASHFATPSYVHETKRVWYYAQDIHRGKRWGTLPNAMLGNMDCSIPGDYRLPVPASWCEAARKLVGYPRTPILVYRPLTFRPEWVASGQRNPDPAAYVEILSAFREHFFMVSIADVDPDHEWFVWAPSIKADLEFHHGELDVQQLAGLLKIADLVYAAPGFALALAQAVETPGIFVFGAHECSASYLASANFAPFLGIDPIIPCECFRPCNCCKQIDVESANARVTDFLREIQASHPVLEPV